MEMRNKKITRDGVTWDVLKILDEESLVKMIKLNGNIREAGEWSKDLTEVKIIALKDKQKAMNHSDHRRYSKASSGDTKRSIK